MKAANKKHSDSIGMFFNPPETNYFFLVAFFLGAAFFTVFLTIFFTAFFLGAAFFFAGMKITFLSLCSPQSIIEVDARESCARSTIMQGV